MKWNHICYFYLKMSPACWVYCLSLSLIFPLQFVIGMFLQAQYLNFRDNLTFLQTIHPPLVSLCIKNCKKNHMLMKQARFGTWFAVMTQKMSLFFFLRMCVATRYSHGSWRLRADFFVCFAVFIIFRKRLEIPPTTNVLVGGTYFICKTLSNFSFLFRRPER